MELRNLLDLITIQQEEAEKRLKDICSKSNILNAEELTKKIIKIVGDVATYKLNTFINVLATKLEDGFVVNSKCWDLTKDQILEQYGDNEDYWDHYFNLVKEHLDYNSVEELKDDTLYWMLSNSLDDAMEAVKAEYDFRYKRGLI